MGALAPDLRIDPGPGSATLADAQHDPEGGQMQGITLLGPLLTSVSQQERDEAVVNVPIGKMRAVLFLLFLLLPRVPMD